MNRPTIRLYRDEDYQQWNDFVSQAKNGTFLFHRHFMEYHKDRFQDFSLMIFADNELIAIVPAHRKEADFYSHWGLTYGGLIVKNNCPIDFKPLIDEISNWLKSQGFTQFFVKPIMDFYTDDASEFDWFSCGFQETSVDENLVLDYSDFQISKSKLKHYRKNLALGYEIKQESPDIFWNEILELLLYEKYKTKPVHSLSEIHRLMIFFPDNIKHYSLYYNQKIQAGITIFETDKVAKSQYGAVSEEGRNIRALDSLFIYLINYYQQHKRFFDMGTVMGDSFPNRINEGLKNQKMELGCKVKYLKKYSKKL